MELSEEGFFEKTEARRREYRGIAKKQHHAKKRAKQLSQSTPDEVES